MKLINPVSARRRTAASLLLGALALATPDARAQTVPAEEAADSPRRAADAEEAVVLSPFEVTTDQDRGYFAANSMSGTRLNTRVEDLASSISIVTKQQLLDTAAVDINDVFLYEGNTEGTHQFTDFEIQNSGAAGDIVVDRTGVNPAGANRIRGLGQANISLGGFEMTGGVPIDTYNVDAIEISRGPNSNLFGLGNPAGTVNLLSGQASLTETRARARFQVDDFGGQRVEASFHLPVVDERLGLAVYGVRDDLGFEQEPAYDLTKRITVAATARPFSRTTIRASFENYDNRASRPNSLTPRDLVSQWRAAGEPTWDPVTGTLTRGDGTTLQSTWGNRASLYEPLGGVDLYSDSFVSRINQFIDQGQLAYFSPGFRPVDIAPTATTVAGPISPGIGANQYHFNLASGHVFPVEQQVLWRAPGVSDRSLYDYEKVNFAAPNFGNKEADTTLVTIDQVVLQTAEHYWALQGGYFSQKVDGWSRNFIGDSGGIAATMMVDINERLLDGTPNPFYLRPFMAGSEPQIKRSLDDADTLRLQSAYRWDFTGRDNWLRWLGVHNLVGYGERRQRTSGTLGFRSYILPDHPWYTEMLPDGTARPKVGNSYRMTYRYYLGDASGQNVDYAPQGLPSEGVYPLYWYNGRTRQWGNEDVTIEELFDANRLKRETRYTLGAIWQANLFNDRIVPTIGFRNDRLTEFEGPSRTWYPDGYPNIEDLDDFHDPEYPYVKNYGEGDTKTAGLVVKPLEWLHFHYNQSDSFRPAGLAYDIYGTVLPNPEGEGKDYGATLRLFDGKFSIRYNQYEVTETNARTGGSSGTMTSRLQRIDFDISRSEGRLPNSTDRWHLEASAYRWVLAEHRVSDPTQLTLDQVESYRREAWDKYLSPAGLDYEYRSWFMDGPTRSFADVNTATARGREIEINYNPDNFLALKATITNQKAFDSGVSVSNTEWMTERLPHWQAVTIPADLHRYDPLTDTWVPHTEVAGKSWWTTWDPESGTTPDVTPESWFQQNVEANMALINARAGQRKPQTREWSFNAVGRYRLAGLGTDNFLRNMTVGGAVRWQDKGAIGYLADTSILNRAGQYYRYDPTRPVFDDDRAEADLMVNYEFRLLDEKVRCLLQLNIRNAFESGGLEVVGVNPDGTARDFRIKPPRQFIFSAAFEF